LSTTAENAKQKLKALDPQRASEIPEQVPDAGDVPSGLGM